MNSTWSGAEVYINVSTDADGYMGDNSINDNKMNISHEVGHALKIRHPHECYESGSYDTDIIYYSIMNQGLPSITSLCTVSPSTFDTRSLKIKWDN